MAGAARAVKWTMASRPARPSARGLVGRSVRGLMRGVMVIAAAALSAALMPGMWPRTPAALAQSAAPSSQAEQPKVGRGERGGAWSAAVQKRAPGGSTKARATSIRIVGDMDRTEIRIDVSRQIVAYIFALDEPARTIVDVPDLDFSIPQQASGRAAGLVASYRYGQFQAGRSRIVIDLAQPARVVNAGFTPPAAGKPGILSFELVRIPDAEFKQIVQPATAAAGALPGEDAPSPKAGPTKPPPALRSGLHQEEPGAASASDVPGFAAGPGGPGGPGPRKRTRPVVMIDPGHGGVDPGAVASAALTEKAVTLAVAQQLRGLLTQSRKYDVYMTRQTDAFVSLDQRLKISRQHHADLFVSIHADALAEQGLAQAISGATVYVLSDKASDELSRRRADKENAVDVLAGLANVPASAEDQVRSILLDLVQRETANLSTSFRGLLVDRMNGRVPLAKDPQRAAAFKVLRQPETPSVLIELGYMSNAGDLARLTKPEGQRQLATTIASAIDAYFAKWHAKPAR